MTCWGLYLSRLWILRQRQPQWGSFTRLRWALKGPYSEGKSFPCGPDYQHRPEIPFAEIQYVDTPLHLPGQPCAVRSLQLICLPPGWHSGACVRSPEQQPVMVLWFTGLVCCSLPQLGSLQQKPKRLRLVVDVSGSMYRFNGVDGRLERSMEAVCMVMEAFENYEEKFKVMTWTKDDEKHHWPHLPKSQLRVRAWWRVGGGSSARVDKNLHLLISSFSTLEKVSLFLNLL